MFLADRFPTSIRETHLQCFFPSTEELSVGVDEIDAQHKLLVDIINRVDRALIGRARRDAAGEILEARVQHTAVHFAVEESLFRVTNYADYERHKDIHEQLKKQVVMMKARFDRREIELDLALMSFLRSWLEEHINGEDRNYVSHLLRSGLKPSWAKSGWVGKIWPQLRV